jgi:hypothetical protein
MLKRETGRQSGELGRVEEGAGWYGLGLIESAAPPHVLWPCPESTLTPTIDFSEKDIHLLECIYVS